LSSKMNKSRRSRSRSRSPSRNWKHSRSDSRSPARSTAMNNSSSRAEDRTRRRRGRREAEEDLSQYQYGKPPEAESDEKKPPPVDKEKPNFQVSGRLMDEFKPMKNGVELRWAEPPDAAKAQKRWKLYPFKDDKQLEEIPLHRKSCYLFGRDRTVCDIPTDHPSCSKQHAVLQFRTVNVEANEILGTPAGKTVKPFLVDLDSTNGSFIKNKKTNSFERVDDSRYYEVKSGDVLKFGLSSREFVLLPDEVIGSSASDNEAKN